ncbi:MAG: (deoxy)nucleoside triphosphate pyrophosphohydrolase [Candidatus Parcubacteria bacterium]|nr:(deoxy)nucleoside triphosphate pyrophosphohydrolase [Candidatus Parcubacteria bacterium]
MIRVSAALIFDDSGHFLIAQRSRGKLAGKWEFPGGKIETDETEKEAIVREIMEELAISVVPKKIVGVFSHTYAEQEVELSLVHCSFLGCAKDLVSDGSHLQHSWIGFEQTGDFDFAPLDRKIVEFLQQTKNAPE